MRPTRSFLKIFLIIGALAAIGLLLVLLFLGRDAAEKIGTALAMPSGLMWLMLMALTIQYWPSRRRNPAQPGSVAMLLTFLLYTLGGNGLLVNALNWLLESPWRQINPIAETTPDVVIVLGGGGSAGANGRVQGNASGDRLILAAQLYQRDPRIRFLCTGRRIESMNSSGLDPADASKDVLVRLGVPEDSIEQIGGRNTAEELALLGKRFHERTEPVGLLTSAWHMTRATRLADRNGLRVTPIPANFQSPSTSDLTAGQVIEAMIPNGNAMSGNWWCVREFLGMLLGR